MTYKKENLIKFLKDNNIEFKEYNHKPLFTVEESKKLRGKIIGNHTKNLFLRDKKKNFFLLSCSENKTIDLKKLRNPINANNLSFASNEYLNDMLGLTPGSVSPFGLINDIQKKTKFYLDEDLLKAQYINFHPLINNSTLGLTVKHFLNFIRKINVELQLINLEVYKIIKNE